MSPARRLGARAWASTRALLPGRRDYRMLGRTWRGDLIAGITVGIVALPLALGFGVSSGLSAEAGIVTAIVAGILAAVFGGSNVQVSGPTGAMVVVLVPIVATHGAGAVVEFAIPALAAVVSEDSSGAVRHLIIGGQSGLAAADGLIHILLDLGLGAGDVPDADFIDLALESPVA